MLKDNAELKMLDISGCSIRARGLLALIEGMTENTALQTVNLEDMQVQCPPQQLTVRALAKLLLQNTILKQLYLGKHALSDSDLQLLVDYGLASNTGLELLDLRANRLSGLCAPCLAKLLKCNKTLQVLNLSSNRISDDAAAVLASQIADGTSLEELDVQNCSMSDMGMQLLAKALMTTDVVKRIFVWGNAFGTGAAAAWRDLALDKQNKGAELHMDIEPYEVNGVPMIAKLSDGN